MNLTLRVIAVCAILFASVSLCFAQAKNQRDQEKEKVYWAQLQKIAPNALAVFKGGTDSLDNGEYKSAVDFYAQVLRVAPKFDVALRRSGSALVALGRREEGLAQIRKAVAQKRSVENLLQLSISMTERLEGVFEPTVTDFQNALVLVREAKAIDPSGEPDVLITETELTLSAELYEQFDAASTELNSKFPGTVQAHYYNAIRFANHGEFGAARNEIMAARALGLTAAVVQEMLTGIEAFEESQSWGYWAYPFYLLPLVGLWIVGLLALFIVGKTLSVKTLNSIDASDANDIHGTAQAGLRSTYRKLINIAGFYYYASQPILVLIIIGTVGGIIFGFIWLGTIPIKLVAVLAIVGLASIFYLVKSLLIRKKAEDPGRALSKGEAPGLWRLVREVAMTIKTRPIDEIRITPGGELAVYERGGIQAKLRDDAERILIIGIATIGGFSQNAFRAVLAHEYGHFSNRDTAGGDVAFRVENDMNTFAQAMIDSGTATHYNIAFQFLRFYHFIFRRITLGATRLQEILADRVAVYHFGAAAFREGLDHVIRRELAFNFAADKEINEALTQQRSFANIYDLVESVKPDESNLEGQFKEILYRKTTVDDSHPSPADRYEQAVLIRSKQCSPVEGDVWDLFTDREALTKEMNDTIEDSIKAMVEEGGA